MFKQPSEKVDSNPLRRELVEKGYSVRAAAKALDISLAQLAYTLLAHDADNDVADRIRALPNRKDAA